MAWLARFEKINCGCRLCGLPSSISRFFFLVVLRFLLCVPVSQRLSSGFSVKSCCFHSQISVSAKKRPPHYSVEGNGLSLLFEWKFAWSLLRAIIFRPVIKGRRMTKRKNSSEHLARSSRSCMPCACLRLEWKCEYSRGAFCAWKKICSSLA